MVEGGRLIRRGFDGLCLCLWFVLKVEGAWEKKKKNGWKAQENGKPRIERNNKERLNKNILIKIEFLDVGGIVKWYGISNKVAFWDGKRK